MHTEEITSKIKELAAQKLGAQEKFRPYMMLYKNKHLLLKATTRAVDSEHDAHSALVELSLLVPCYRANRVVYAFDANLEDGGEGLVIAMLLKSGYATIEQHPYSRNNDNSFEKFLAPGTPGNEALDSDMLGVFSQMFDAERFYLGSTAIVHTLTRFGHEVELFNENIQTAREEAYKNKLVSL
jgi:hypothetical protein